MLDLILSIEVYENKHKVRRMMKKMAKNIENAQ